MAAVFPLLVVLLSVAPAAATQQSFAQIAQEAETARAADRVNDAIHLYKEGVRLRPSWNEGWWWLGGLLYDEDRFPEAQAAFQRFIAIAPKPGPAYAFLGLCEYETKDYDHALQHFRAWARTGWAGTPDLINVAVFHFALLLTRDSRFVEAMFLLVNEAGKLRGSPPLIEAMGLASLRMASLPEDYSPERREMVWLAGKAAFYSSLTLPAGEATRSDEYAGRLLLHYGQEPNVHYFLGTLFRFQDKDPEAAEEFRRELQKSPQHVPAMVELARIDLHDSQLPEAVSLATHAAEIEPKNAEAHHVLGEVFFATKKFQDCARELETAKQLAPDSATIRFHLARTYRKLGRSKEAEQEMAAFTSLQGKEGVLAPPKEKLRRQPVLPR